MKARSVPTRWWLILLSASVIPLAYGAYRLSVRRSGLLGIATVHGWHETAQRRTLARIKQHRRVDDVGSNDRFFARLEEATRLRMAYHAALREKYRRAAYRPWETPALDPSDPGLELEAQAWTDLVTDAPPLTPSTLEPLEPRFERLGVPMPQKVDPIPVQEPSPPKERPSGDAKPEAPDRIEPRSVRSDAGITPGRSASVSPPAPGRGPVRGGRPSR